MNFFKPSHPDCLLISAIVLSALLAPCPIRAQIVPDSTLPVNSAIAPDGNTATITGGSRAGGNLFHSFREFSVLTGSTAYFNNASDIQNIITRVTGSSPSNIDGLIKANGSANLFLINPNGISFGANARLNIGGSFIGSTANSLKFADGTEFSAANPSATPLLTVSVPIGLQFGGANEPAIASQTPGSIAVRGGGHDGITYDAENDQPRVTLNDSDRGLKVQREKSIALVGGTVSLEGAILQAPAGRVELASIAGNGTVELNLQPSGETRLRFPDGVDRSDISLSNRALVDVAASGGGSIAIHARNLNISGVSALRGGIKSESSTGSRAGDIEINATGRIALPDNSQIFNNVESGAVGSAGDIKITADSLSLANGGALELSTYGQGDAGDVDINVRNTVSFDGQKNSDEPSAIGTKVGPKAVGNAGDINITAGSLSLSNGAAIVAFSDGRGNAGTVTINADTTVLFDRAWALSYAGEQASGEAGNIKIEARSLSLSNGAQLGAYSLGEEDAGNINVTASDRVLLDNRGSINAASASGNGGNIGLRSRNILLRRQSQISAVSDRSKEGNITINAETLVLLESSSIITLANAPNGGSNIRISRFNKSPLAVFVSPGSTILSQGELDLEDIAAVDPSDIPDVKVTSVEGQIAPGCEAYEGSSFVVTGRGGLPPNPDDPLASNAVVVEWAGREAGDSGMENEESGLWSNHITNAQFPMPNAQSPLVEATGWTVAPSGAIILTAAPPAPTLQDPGLIHPGCRFP